MGRIFIATGKAGNQAAKIIEIQQAILLRDQLIAELRSRRCEVLAIPDDLSLSDSIEWINDRYCQGDIALEIAPNNLSNNTWRRTSVFYIANNIERKKHAELILLLLMRRLPQIMSQGSKPDTFTERGNLSFCRQVIMPSLLIEINLKGDSEQSNLINSNHRKIVLGLADGLIAWSREVAGVEPNQSSTNLISTITYPNINIQLNNRNYDEQGILINGNAYIPIDLSDRLEIDLLQSSDVRLVQYQGIVYFKAIELRDNNISVTWDNLSRTVVLRSILPINQHKIDQIMGQGNTSEVQLIMFLKANYENALIDFPELPKIYREEGQIEGVNYDIAFCQMCLETQFLRFGSDISASGNNFANLGSIGGEPIATFPSPRIGIRAQIQHLKAYASWEPLGQEIVDPRFHWVRRGVAPLVSHLSGRWSADLSYGDKIMAMLRRLYESANLL